MNFPNCDLLCCCCVPNPGNTRTICPRGLVHFYKASITDKWTGRLGRPL